MYPACQTIGEFPQYRDAITAVTNSLLPVTSLRSISATEYTPIRRAVALSLLRGTIVNYLILIGSLNFLFFFVLDCRTRVVHAFIKPYIKQCSAGTKISNVKKMNKHSNSRPTVV